MKVGLDTLQLKYLYAVVICDVIDGCKKDSIKMQQRDDRIHLPYNMTARMARDTTAGTFLPAMIIATLIKY